MDDVYKRIKEIRQSKGITQTELAERVGYKSGKSMIAKIETGHIDLPMIKVSAIADALGVDPMFLMGWDTEDNKPNVKPDYVAKVENSETYVELRETLQELNEENQKKVLDIAKAYLSTQRKE